VGATSALDLNVGKKLVRTLEMPLNKIEIIGALQAIIEAIQSAARLPLLILIDGLDKVRPAQAASLFSDTRLLCEPGCALIYAAPIDLCFRSNRVAQMFNEFPKLPTPPVNKRPPTKDEWRREREENVEGIDLLCRVVARRQELRGLTIAQVIENDALRLLARMSGGICPAQMPLLRS
jgi:hypothetical protein